MKNSIQNKILLLIAVLVVLSISVLGTLNYLKTDSIVNESFNKRSSEVIKTIDSSVIDYMSNLKYTLEMVGGSGILTPNPTKEEETKMITYFDNIVNNNPNIAFLYIGTKDKKMFVAPNMELPDGYDPITREWYKKAVEAKKVVWIEPHIDVVTGKKIGIVAKPLIINNEVVGVYAINFFLDSVIDYISNIKLGETGYFSIVNDNQIIMIHPNKDLIGKENPVADIKTSMDNNSKGSLKYTFDGKVKYGIFDTLESTGWRIMGMVDFKEIKAASNSALIYIIISGLIILVFAMLLGYYVSRLISKPIIKLVEASDKLAMGDIDVSVEVDSKDEIGILADSFRKMILGIKNQAAIAEKIASGDLSIEVRPYFKKDVLANSMKLVVETLRNLVGEANILTNAAVEGRFDTRGDIEKFNGGYKEIVQGVNGTLDTMVDKIYWYESILDSIPNPISVTDLNMNWTFTNKAMTNTINVNREDIIGKQYSNWNTNICNTEDCAIARFKNNNAKTTFEQAGHNLNVDTSYLYDKDGEKIGHIELIRDITEEYRKRNYQKTEVERLADNLQLLSEGNLNLTFNVAEADEYTVEDRENFMKINNYFKGALESISTKVGEVSRILSEISEGNLDVETSGEYEGDFAEIKTSLNLIIDSLNDVLSDINNAADQVATGSRQVSDSSMSLSQGATEQASSVEELTASIEEIAAQTKQNAENANEAKEIAETAKANAAKGKTQMQEMLTAMAEINDSSNNISKIIKVIDEIAFQTNILALNAAVEAARAGQHGKGFAVVAEEVRNLAARSANAAKETTAMIEGSIKKVEDGTKIANVTADALNNIVEGVAKASNLVSEIAFASNEQALGVEQINQGVNQIANVVQTTSATSEETAAASEELSSQAQMLKNQVGKVKLKKYNEIVSYKEIEDLNPEVIKMLENISEKNKYASKEPKEEITKASIELSDKEFDKY